MTTGVHHTPDLPGNTQDFRRQVLLLLAGLRAEFAADCEPPGVDAGSPVGTAEVGTSEVGTSVVGISVVDGGGTVDGGGGGGGGSH